MPGTDGPDGGERVPPEEEGVPFDESRLDVPNCPSCLHRMEAVETRAGGVHWACPACGQRRLA